MTRRWIERVRADLAAASRQVELRPDLKPRWLYRCWWVGARIWESAVSRLLGTRGREPWQDRGWPALLWQERVADACDARYRGPGDRSLILRTVDRERGGILWCQLSALESFAREVCPALRHPIVLVTSIGDRTTPDEHTIDVGALAQNGIIHTWFSQNPGRVDRLPIDLNPLPLGMDYHTQSRHAAWGSLRRLDPPWQEERVKEIREAAGGWISRRPRIFYDGHLADTLHWYRRSRPHAEIDLRSRAEVVERLRAGGLTDLLPRRLERYAFFRKMAEYRYVLSLPGVGLDCHRHWEALALGCVPILLHSSLDPIYAPLPTLLIADVAELTTERLERDAERFASAFGSGDGGWLPELTFEHWWARIVAARETLARTPSRAAPSDPSWDR